MSRPASLTSFRSETSIFTRKSLANDQLQENEKPLSGTVLPDGTVLVRTFMSEEELVELPHQQHLISKPYKLTFWILFIVFVFSLIMIIATVLLEKPWVGNKGL